MSNNDVSSTSQNVTIPYIPELFGQHFLDTLLPAATAPTDSYLTLCAHNERGPAYSSTLSATLDAFHELRPCCAAHKIPHLLEKSWREDPSLTLRIIWNIRSIHDGKGEKELFYQAFGWLYEKHPHTAIQNLRWLVEPVCALKAGGEPSAPHGYWKDLLNIVALAALDQLRPLDKPATFLHAPRTASKYRYRTRRWSRWEREPCESASSTALDSESVDAGKAHPSQEKEQAESRRRRIASHQQYHTNLVDKLAEPRFRALYIMVARLFAERLRIQKSDVVSCGSFH
ncbi:hypothetical protein NM688_g9252 [Phlebia brevispora]|uniref:Uncharacterized protein n=1 Tax=Phlebia brevispora TaxID=194682 RepID=A0ACC1RL95_9APHY|nr:hypothetical protein NM688_g9252 [Phlebia brevispora]